MGHTSYSETSRSLRSESLGYMSRSVDEIFIQNKKRVIHESMDPKKALLRESRDSETHPFSVPIILALDLTGSMRRIPHYLVKEGLPNMVAGIIQHGVLDPQILFIGVGDTTCDDYPLQVGQFESGDAELDLWLTRTYLEGGGGGNDGESYHLAWYYGAFHTVTDSWEKRKQKGFIFTIGDEPCLDSLSLHEITEVMGSGTQKSFTDKELLEKAQEKYNVYHLHMMEGSAGQRSLGYWRQLLGDHCIKVEDQKDVARIISELVTSNVSPTILVDSTSVTTVIPSKNDEMML